MRGPDAIEDLPYTLAAALCWQAQSLPLQGAH
jgi:hypothetical protein